MSQLIEIATALMAQCSVPERGMFEMTLAALVVSEAMALKATGAFGVKRTLAEMLCPAARLTGRPGAISAKYLVEIAARLIVIEVFP